MYNIPKKDAKHGFSKSLASATSWFQENFRNISKTMVVLSIFIAVVVAATIGGNIGTVKIDNISYIPFHEISLQNVIVYGVGILVVVIAILFWYGKAFSILGGSFKILQKDVAFACLRFLQGCMLSFFVFGILGTAIGVAAGKVNVWLWVLFALYILFISVPLYIVEYDYMLTNHSYRESLRHGIKAIREQWGRVFFRVLFVNAVAVVLMVVAMLPGAALMLSIYDNATAMLMDGATPTPLMIFVLEYLFIVVGCIAALGIKFWALAALKECFNECCAYSTQLAADKE